MSLTEIVQQDLSRGANLVTQPYLLGKQQSIVLVNLLLDEHGSLRVRDGSTILGTSPDNPFSARPIVKFYNFILSPAAPPTPPPAPPPGGAPIGGGEGTGGGDPSGGAGGGNDTGSDGDGAGGEGGGEGGGDGSE